MEDVEKIAGQEEQIAETAALDSVKTKSASMADIVKRMEGMNHDDITKLSAVIGQVGKETDALPAKANAEANKNTIKAVKEDLATIFGKENEELSEEFLDDMGDDARVAFMTTGDLARVGREITRDEAVAIITADQPQFVDPAWLTLVLSSGSFFLTDGRTIVTRS